MHMRPATMYKIYMVALLNCPWEWYYGDEIAEKRVISVLGM